MPRNVKLPVLAVLVVQGFDSAVHARGLPHSVDAIVEPLPGASPKRTTRVPMEHTVTVLDTISHTRRLAVSIPRRFCQAMRG